LTSIDYDRWKSDAEIPMTDSPFQPKKKTMKNIVFAALSLLVVLCIEVNAQTLKKVWETTGLENPESVIFDAKRSLYYVSNVVGSPVDKDGNGYITQLDENGKIVKQKWITGFNAPKGLGIHNGKLYVADIDQVVMIDIASAKIEKSLPAEGATFLNDIVVASNGDVYISDTFGGNSIYRIQNGKIEIWLKDPKLDFPNGLLLKGNDIYVASWGVVTNQETFATDVKGKILKASLNDKKITDVTTSFINGDGLVPFKNGFIATDWNAGKVFFIDNKGATTEIGSYNQGTADIEFVTNKNLLLIPQMSEGKVLAFSVK
jgi:sugar lactone lactonase YvrE